MFNDKGKPVDITIIEHTYIDGQLVTAGTQMQAAPPELAMELAAAGKARVTAALAKARAGAKA